MNLILGIETATSTCSIAVHREGILLAEHSYYLDRSHSNLLAPCIEHIMHDCGFELSALSAIALSKGPGSYTGLRIGTSTAKGLCYALDIPLIAINTLEAMAHGVHKYNTAHHWLCPMLDARRMEVYTMLLDGQLNEIEATHPLVVETTSFKDHLKDRSILFFGNGAGKCRDILQDDNAIFLEGVEPTASQIGRLAYQKFLRSEFEDLAYFEPFYLKEFQATKPKVKI